jgi:hypothetical protein
VGENDSNEGVCASPSGATDGELGSACATAFLGRGWDVSAGGAPMKIPMFAAIAVCPGTGTVISPEPVCVAAPAAAGKIISPDVLLPSGASFSSSSCSTPLLFSLLDRQHE